MRAAFPLSVFAAALFAAACGRFAGPHAPYAVSVTCDGWARAPIGMAAGFCAGVVAQAEPALKFPRRLLELGPGEWLVVDMGGWDGVNAGTIFRMYAKPGERAVFKSLLTGLDKPDGIGVGPDGKIYLGEATRIVRFDPYAPNPPSTVAVVVVGLPGGALKDYLHPLKDFVFDANGDLLINVGSSSDRCAGADGKADGISRCAQSDESKGTAGIRRYAYEGSGRWSTAFVMFASGLRNSVALARHASGTLLEADNGIDFPDAESPNDELNVLKEGAFYGWPYCYNMDGQTPLWAGEAPLDCASAAHESPARLLPPHAAPLAMLYYQGPMFPELNGYLLQSWHGYRPTGSRIVAFAVDSSGVPELKAGARFPEYGAGGTAMKPYGGPASEPLILTPGWDDVPGMRAMGAPTGLAIAEDGAIWVAEDRNKTILRIARDKP